ARRIRLGVVEKSALVREKHRIRVSLVAAGRIEPGDRPRFPTLRRYALDRRIERPQQDDAIAVPGALNIPFDLTQCSRNTACKIDTHQTVTGGVGDGTAIRRPEGTTGGLGPRNPLKLDAIQRPQPQLPVAFAGFRSDDNEPFSAGRN